MKTMYRVNHSNKTITVSPKFLKAAGILDTPEYKTMMRILEDNPSYEIVCEGNKKATKKNSYRNLTIDNMEIFIRNSQDDTRNLQTRLDEFNTVKELSKSQTSKYAYIKKWFLKTYGNEYNKYAKEMENSEDESIAS